MFKPLARQPQADVLSRKSLAESEHVHLFSLCRGIDASSSTQSVWSEKQQYILSLCPWNVLSPKIVSLAACVVTITVCTAFDGWKLIWIKTQLQREGGEKIRRCLLYMETKRGRKSVAKERGQPELAAWACFACTGASVGEGVDRAPQCCLQLSDNSCSERGDVLRVLRHVSLSLHLSFHLSASSFQQSDIR